jgi:hypothetical protein
MGPIGMPELIMILIVAIMMALVGVLPFWFICKKAGLSPWLSLIMIIPFGALVLPFVIAFIEWPALRGDRSVLPRP